MCVGRKCVFWVVLLVALATGCMERDLKPLTPCTVSGFVSQVQANPINKVDLLFLVDNSGSMGEEQASLAEQFPHLVTVLATGDRGVPGSTPFPPVNDLHVGVVTSDMGNGGFPVPTCATTFGDDGILVTRGNTSVAGCMATYPSFLGFMPPEDPVRFAHDFECVARVGTGGCGFEQHLEAALKAVTPSTSPIAFNMGTTGHADRENAGFLRDDSVIGLVVVGDEDDCSVIDPELFNPGSSVYSGDLNLRCFTHPSAVHPIGRFVDGFRALRPANPEQFVFAAITGVPPDLVADPEHIDYDALLADPRMVERVDTTTGMARLTPSCDVPGRGIAFPPRRIVSVAQQFGRNGIVQSICQSDFGPALDAIIDKIADVLGKVCLPRALNPDETGHVACDVIEVLPATGDVTSCDQIAGRSFLRMGDPAVDGPGAAGRQVCRVDQVSASGGLGWYYDDLSALPLDDMRRQRCPATSPQRIAFTGGAEPAPLTDVRLECLQPVQTLPGVAAGAISIGTPCRIEDHCADGRIGGVALACESASGSCQLPCVSDADCTGVGLAGFLCDTRAESGLAMPVCVNATCGG